MVAGGLIMNKVWFCAGVLVGFIGLLCVITLAGLIISGNTMPEGKLVKHYTILDHSGDVNSLYTNQGIFLTTDKDQWDKLELNHTYTCDEGYSGTMLMNCTEIASGV